MKSLLRSLILMSALFLMSCAMNELETITMMTDEIESIKKNYSANSSLAVFDVQIERDGDAYVFNGWSDQSQALKDFELFLESNNIDFRNQIVLLPDSTVLQTPFAIVNNSVCNIRSNPKHSAELATQALLGTTLKMLRKTEEWYLVQTPDGYISWVDHGGVILMNEQQKDDWESSAKVIFMKISGNITSSTENLVISDVVLGDIVKLDGLTSDHFLIKLPDGREGKLPKNEALLYDEWLNDLEPSGDLVETYARQMLGFPYLWGGTSTKGMDCSGFTQTIFRMNGMTIARDASQQIESGVDVDTDLNYEQLVKGDLVFFGRKATDSTERKVTHVGLWLGENTFIHASQKVRLSSFDPKSPYYDEFNLNRYLGARRYLSSSDLVKVKIHCQ